MKNFSRGLLFTSATMVVLGLVSGCDGSSNEPVVPKDTGTPSNAPKDMKEWYEQNKPTGKKGAAKAAAPAPEKAAPAKTAPEAAPEKKS
jgi:hypothetical protein